MISDKLREQGQGERLLKEALRRIERTVVDKETLKKREKGRIVERYIRMKIGQEKARSCRPTAQLTAVSGVVAAAAAPANARRCQAATSRSKAQVHD